jgi:hypothetical protein
VQQLLGDQGIVNGVAAHVVAAQMMGKSDDADEQRPAHLVQIFS